MIFSGTPESLRSAAQGNLELQVTGWYVSRFTVSFAVIFLLFLEQRHRVGPGIALTIEQSIVGRTLSNHAGVQSLETRPLGSSLQNTS